MTIKALSSVLVSAIVAATPVAAQDPVLALNPTTMIGYAGTVAAGEYAKRDLGRSLTQRRPARRGVTAAGIAARTMFRPDPAVRNRVYARTIAMVQKTSPAEAAKMRQFLLSGRFRSEVAKYMARYRMSSNNLVDATALYLATAWFASRADGGDPTPAQMRGLRSQVALVMAGTPGMLNASNAVKQEIAEASLVQAMFAGSLANEGARNPHAAGPYRAAAVRWVQNDYQIDLSRMTLTADGLR